MKLTDLDAEWVTDYDPIARSHRVYGDDLSIATAQGDGDAA